MSWTGAAWGAQRAMRGRMRVRGQRCSGGGVGGGATLSPEGAAVAVAHEGGRGRPGMRRSDSRRATG